ncbi:LOW QUALITY PROTEIN: hypothetical protein TorRG33x02_019490 [Trema orientale]|uniref:Transmembrane protein n=1 Tax=Trema orientale TaxID=63057 RepID=A0A2P5FWL6_TREOI|nr:LOW QUALITY PROTEIN: hypothetical protein TorRG33x02_019490 [Trema orientale]
MHNQLNISVVHSRSFLELLLHGFMLILCISIYSSFFSSFFFPSNIRDGQICHFVLIITVTKCDSPFKSLKRKTQGSKVMFSASFFTESNSTEDRYLSPKLAKIGCINLYKEMKLA